MVKSLKRVAVTGGAGQIAYSLLFRIAAGEMLGKDQPIALHILELPEAFKALEGVKMELEDCAFPLLKEIHVGTNAEEVFKGVHYALLVGAKPRTAGMERGDLLKDNGKIFIGQGKALNDFADPNVKIFVVGNPCNTNCLITMQNAPKIPKQNFHAMTRLDENRSISKLAIKASVDVQAVENMTIWGNHSATQVPDYLNAKIQGRPVVDVIKDLKWLQNDFISGVQKRGSMIIEARGKSSAASAANAIIDAIKAISTLTPEGKWFSSAIFSKGNPYGIDENLVFSFPCRTNAKGDIEIVNGLKTDDFLKGKIKETEKELIEERSILGL